jgi:hypothetical protein
MSVLDKLANALGRNDEQPNVALAEALVARPDAAAIAELCGALVGPTAIANDAIKVLYEIGERQPALLAGHAGALLATLASRNNRMVWGGLSALAAIAGTEAKTLVGHLREILAAADKGSVIAKDKAMSILSQLAPAGFAAKALPPLLERLREAAPNQFPTYAELALPAIDAAHRAAFRTILETRLKAIEAPAKRARVEKVLKKLGR